MPHISTYAIAFSAFSLSNIVLRLLNILAANDYRYWQLDIEQIEVKNVKTVQKRPINNNDYDSPSLDFAYAENMRKNMLHMQHICAAYFAKFRIFFRILCLQKFRIF